MNNNIAKHAKIVLALALTATLGACMAGSGEAQHAAEGGALPQFLLGLWHGIIAPVTLIGAVINQLSPTVLPWRFQFFETANASLLYDIGFYLGIAVGPPALLTGWSRRSRA